MGSQSLRLMLISRSLRLPSQRSRFGWFPFVRPLTLELSGLLDPSDSLRPRFLTAPCR
jgi:hypothetical protein